MFEDSARPAGAAPGTGDATQLPRDAGQQSSAGREHRDDGTLTPVAQNEDSLAATMPSASHGVERGVPAELAAHSRYRIVRRLGCGGMGDVYQAEHRLMERLVAIKVILPELMANRWLVERFQREVKAAAKLAHPNIVTAYDAEQAGGLHFLVMEYVEGVDLAQVVAKHGPLPVVKACHFVRQAALGLQHAFEKGMVHRDIKPQNLMLTPKGQVKILDFGIARFAREKLTASAPADVESARLVPGGTQLTKSGSVVGTADYMAPEQAIDASKADTRADIYSLGCSFYYLLTGQVPFPGGAFIDKIMRHAEEHWISVERLRPEVPQEVIAVVNKMMAKNPARRFQTPAEVAKALEPIIRAATAKPASPPLAPRQEAPSPNSRVSKMSTYAVARQPTPSAMDIAAVLDAEIPPLPPPERVKPPMRHAKAVWAVAGLVGGAIVTVAFVVWDIASIFRGPSGGPARGTLQVDSSVAPHAGVAVKNKQGGRSAGYIDAADGWTLDLDAGDYDLVLAHANQDEYVLDPASVTVRPGGKAVAKVIAKPKTTPADSPPTQLGGAAAANVASGPSSPVPQPGSSSQPASLPVKNQAPSVRIVGVEPAAPQAGGSLTLTLESSDPEGDPVTIEYHTDKYGTRLDAEWSAAVGLSVTFSNLPAGALTIHVRGRDKFGNISPVEELALDVKPATPAPPLAVVPFSAENAKRHQQAWAAHLNVEVSKFNAVGIKLVLIPPGKFMMGQGSDNKPTIHEVTLTKAFYLANREVTVKQFQKFIKDSQYPATEKPSDWAGASPRYSPEPDCPVQQVNWFDAILYCNWLSTREGMTRCYESTGKCDFEADGYRLPTEAEWEYACRAGSPDAFCFGNDMQFLTKYGWFGNPAKNKTHPCGKLLPSAWDLFDMHGNVWEWCWDWYTSYPADPLIDPKGPDAGSGRVIRGGAFDSSASGCQSACRDVGRPVVRDVTLGFRVSCGR